MNQGYSSSGRAGMNPGYGQPIGQPMGQPPMGMGMGMGGPHHPPYEKQGGISQGPTTYPSQQQVLNNQAQPQVVQIVQQGAQQFGTMPVSMTCQFCQKPITTEVTTTCNCGSCCLCCWSGLFIWICIQCHRNKELNCKDAQHKCPNCQNVLGNYVSC